MELSAKPWSVSQFELYRPELTEFVRNELVPAVNDPASRIKQIIAPVKSGKREMVEYLAARDGPERTHAFISALHRVADNSQRDELKLFGVAIFKVESGPGLARFRAWLSSPLPKLVHLDESDYGTGYAQVMAAFWSLIVAAAPQLTTVLLYSATPQESIWSSALRDLGPRAVATYAPPPSYCGASRFLREGLVRESEPFFDYDDEVERYSLSPQGAEILGDMRAALERAALSSAPAVQRAAAVQRTAAVQRAPARNVIVLRLACGGASSSKTVEGRLIYEIVVNLQHVPEFRDVVVLVDKDCMPKGIKIAQRNVFVRAINWDNPQFDSALPTVVLIDQKCSRSTEWNFHDRVFAYHECRPSSVYSTVLQATLRCAHYATKYGGFQPIRIYSRRSVLEYSLAAVTKEDLISEGISFGDRISAVMAPNPHRVESKFFLVAARADVELMSTREVHDVVCRLSRRFVDDASLPASVRDHEFKPRATFRQNKITGKFMGLVRKYAEYQYDQVRHESWGLEGGPRLTGCYLGDDLGFVVRWFSDDARIPPVVANVRAKNSMYNVRLAAPAAPAAPAVQAGADRDNHDNE